MSVPGSHASCECWITSERHIVPPRSSLLPVHPCLQPLVPVPTRNKDKHPRRRDGRARQQMDVIILKMKSCEKQQMVSHTQLQLGRGCVYVCVSLNRWCKVTKSKNNSRLILMVLGMSFFCTWQRIKGNAYSFHYFGWIRASSVITKEINLLKLCRKLGKLLPALSFLTWGRK